MDDYLSRLRPDRGIFPLSELAERCACDFGDKPVMRTWNGTGYDEITYNEFYKSAHSVAVWLLEQGIGSGDRVAVLSENRPEWGMSYLGVQMAGAVVVPVDSLMPVTGIRHILSDSESRILFASSKFITSLSEVSPVDSLEQKICFDDEDIDGSVLFSKVVNIEPADAVELPKRELDEMAAILYTSGTTGHSKGVMLSQNNIMSNVAAASRIFPVGESDTFLSVLPLHHAFECTAGFLLPLYCGCSITYARSLKSNELIGDIRNTNVTMMVGVPLLYEKMHAGIIRGIRKKGKKTESLFKTMYKAVSLGDKFGLTLGDRVFHSLREKAGFGTVKYFVSGGGPLDPATAQFFNRLGIRLVQGYGLTETSPVTHVIPPWRIRHATVGPPIVGVECKLDNLNKLGIGEICVRGPNIFMGYYRNEEATKEVLDSDGWFHTGDLGLIYSDNYLQIMGRMKNMILTSGGKNVYPEEIEHYLNHSRFIAESLVMGIQRESGYGEEVVALVYPDYEQIDLHFEHAGHKPSEDEVFQLIKTEINDSQADLADYKRIIRFRIITEEFQKTSTRKIKRFLYDSEMFKVDDGKG